MNPLVTINILSYNRKNELRNTLQKVYEQSYKNIEVIVVDNASTDGSTEMIKKEFPNVILNELNENIGIAGWNKGFEIAKGDYILVLDDDAYPEFNSLKLAVNECNQNTKIACIAFNVIDMNKKNKKRTIWLPPLHVVQCTWPIFVGCAALFKKEKISKNPMPKNYFIYQHELPVAADIYNSKNEILYRRDILAYHFFKDQQDYSSERDKIMMKNNLKFITTYLPNYILPFYLLQNLLFFFSRSINKKWFKQYLKTLFTMKYYKSKKEKIDFKYFLMLRKLKLFNLPLLSKIL